MIRRAAAIVLGLMLNPALLHAQDTVLTVTVPSADVHKGPSTATPVIGHVSQGTVLPISRDLGSWVKIPWTGTPDGIGYVHVTMGRLSPLKADSPAASTPSRVPVAPTPTPTSAPAAASEPASMTPRTRTSAQNRVAVSGPQGVTPISHTIGVGGLVGSMSTFGATSRAWRNDHLGIQCAFTRDVMTSDLAAGRVTSMQFEPGVVYALFDHVSDYFWIRPYVGSGVSFRHQTLTLSAPAAIEPTSDNGIGFRVFGGTELTFAAVTRFGLSAELGYRRYPTPFAGFEANRFSVSVAGHWYIK